MLSSKEQKLFERALKALHEGEADPSLMNEINLTLANASANKWWVIALKVLAYAIGLILGGAVTTSCSTLFF